MEGEQQEVKKKGLAPHDLEKLFDRTFDDYGDDVEQKQREELRKLRDKELEESIVKFGRTLKMVGHKLPDGGVNMRASIKRYRDELDRRRLRLLVKEQRFKNGTRRQYQRASNPLVSTTNASTVSVRHRGIFQLACNVIDEAILDEDGMKILRECLQLAQRNIVVMRSSR